MIQANIYHYSHTAFLVESRSRPGEFHKVEFQDDEKYPEVCSCEDFQMGIPRMVKEGKIPDTIEHRRCWHIRAVRSKLADLLQEHLVNTDPSTTVFQRRQPEMTWERVRR